MDDFDFGDDFNIDFDDKPAKKKDEPQKKTQADPILDDMNDFYFGDSPQQPKGETKPDDKKQYSKKQPKNDDDQFIDDFGDFGKSFDDFSASPDKKLEKPKKDPSPDLDDFKDPFATPEKKEVLKVKDPEPPKDVKQPAEQQNGVDDVFPQKKNDYDGLLDDFADFNGNFGPQPKAPSKPQPGPTQAVKKPDPKKDDDFLSDDDPFNNMDNILDLPIQKKSEPSSRAASQKRSNSAKKTFLPTPQRKNEPQPAQVIPQQKPVTDLDINLQPEQPKHVTFDKPNDVDITNPVPQPHFDPVQVNTKPLAQQNDPYKPVVDTMQFQQMSDDIQLQLKAIAQSMEILVDGQRRQQQQISDLQNKQFAQQRPDADNQLIDQRLSKLESQLEKLSQNTLQFNTFVTEFSQKQGDLQRQQQEIDQQNAKLQVQRGTLVAELESLESRREAVEGQQANIQQLIQSANQLIRQTQDVDEALKQRLENLFAEKSIDQDVQKLISRSINQQIEASFRNYTGNVTELLSSNQLQIIQLLKQIQPSGSQESSVQLSQLIQQQLQLFTTQLMAQLGDRFAAVDAQFVNIEGGQARLPEQVGGAVQSAVSQVLRALPTFCPADGATGAAETGQKTCAVYLELVKQLQAKVQAAEQTLRSQNDNITEQQLAVRLQGEENERLRQRLEVAEKHVQVQLQRATELEEENRTKVQHLHAKERELVLREQNLKRRAEEADQRVRQAELLETQLEKLRIEIQQKRDELRSQQLVMEVEAEKRDFRQLQDIEDRLMPHNRPQSAPMGSPTHHPAQYYNTPAPNGVVSQQNTFQQQQNSFSPWPVQNTYFPPRPSHGKLTQSDMASFQQAKQQLKDIVTRGSSISSGSAIIDEPVDQDIDQKLQALKISHGIASQGPQKQVPYALPGRSASSGPSMSIQSTAVQNAVQAQEQMLQQLQQQQELMQQQMTLMLQQQQNQAQNAKSEPQPPKQSAPVGQTDSTPSDGAALQAVRPFTPMNKLQQSSGPGAVALNGVTPLQPDHSLDVSSGGAVVGSESRDAGSGPVIPGPVLGPQSVATTQKPADSLLSSQATSRTVQQMGTTKPPKQPLQASESVLEPKQVPVMPTNQSNLKNPFAESQSDNPAPMTLQSTSDNVVGAMKAFQGKESQISAGSTSGVVNVPGGQNIKILTDEESGLSAYDFKFQYNNPVQLQSQSGVPESAPGVSQSAPGMQVSSSAPLGTTEKPKESPGKSSSRAVNNPFEEGTQSQSGLRNHFNEFKYDNDNFNIFQSGSKSSTSPFFPF